MERQKEQNSSMAVAKYIQQLRNNTMRYSSEMVDLVEEDIKYGLTMEQTQIYAKHEFEFAQMKIISECLRKGTNQEFIDLLVKYPKINGYKMQVALEFYEKGIPISSVEEVIVKGEAATKMRICYEAILKKMEEVKRASEVEPEYVKELIDKIEGVVTQIHHQDERYDELNKKLAEFEIGKRDDEVKEGLVKKLTDTEASLSSQQDQLNKASSTIARLREQIDYKNKEMSRMQTRIDTLEDKLLEKAARADASVEETSDETVDAEEIRESEEKVVKPPMDEKASKVPTMDVFGTQAFQIPVYYQMPIVDGNRVVTTVPVEKTVRRTSEGGVAGLLSKLGFKKKSRQDIVKLVASGDLVPAQLVQIKSAIMQGLTEGQLVELINNNVSAEKMKEIIEIAVLENSMDY